MGTLCSSVVAPLALFGIIMTSCAESSEAQSFTSAAAAACEDSGPGILATTEAIAASDTPEELADSTQEFSEVISDLVSALEELMPPEDDAVAFGSFVDTLERSRAAFDEMVTAIAEGEAEEVGALVVEIEEIGTEGEAIAEDLGLPECGAELGAEEGAATEDAVEADAHTTALEYGMTEKQWDEYLSDIDLAIQDLTEFWAFALPKLYGIDHTPPTDFRPYTSEEDAPSCGGQALEPGNAFYCYDENFIAWDHANLMIPYFMEVGDFAIAFILAHEWGHAVQDEVGARGKFTIQYELQADCYAGAWAIDADFRGLIEKGDIDESLYALASASDLRGTPWTDPSAHGRPRDRIGAFVLGYERGPRPCTRFTN